MLQRSETKTAISRVGYPDRIRYVQMVGRACRPTRVKPPVQILTVPDCESMGVVKIENPDWYYTGKLFSPPERLSNGQVRVDRGHGLEYWNIGPRGSNHSLNDGLRDSKWRAAERWMARKSFAFREAAIDLAYSLSGFVEALLSGIFFAAVLMSSVAGLTWVLLKVVSAMSGIDL